jgi:hypothetical protein
MERASPGCLRRSIPSLVATLNATKDFAGSRPLKVRASMAVIRPRFVESAERDRPADGKTLCVAHRGNHDRSLPSVGAA